MFFHLLFGWTNPLTRVLQGVTTKTMKKVLFIDKIKDSALRVGAGRVSQEEVVGGSLLRIQLLSSSISGWESWWWRPEKEWKAVVIPAFLSSTDMSLPHWWSTRLSLVPWHWNNSGRECPARIRSSTAFKVKKLLSSLISSFHQSHTRSALKMQHNL